MKYITITIVIYHILQHCFLSLVLNIIIYLYKLIIILLYKLYYYIYYLLLEIVVLYYYYYDIIVASFFFYDYYYYYHIFSFNWIAVQKKVAAEMSKYNYYCFKMRLFINVLTFICCIIVEKHSRLANIAVRKHKKKKIKNFFVKRSKTQYGHNCNTFFQFLFFINYYVLNLSPLLLLLTIVINCS